NFFGTFQMMQAFLPLLKNSSNSKIIILALSVVVWPPGEFPLRSVVVKPGVTPNTSGPLVANSLLKANVKALSETNYNGKILNKDGIIPW
ncbi:short-chain dehydrogenase, partial [Bacillus thuringiensis]|nr:short-chain dehydrogenase [Bacillus thuringiensis]